ncbi:MAG: WG repeat-containing protein [Coprobacillus cateniformis]|uniref:WG repeat-containing protein n=1 Tax=Longibaculum muris TaxID=1796628 RepID=UPI003AB5DD18|nr:WG repeat-containing protein [Coprobacillus cateniformis]
MKKNLKYIMILIIAFLGLGWGSFVLNFGNEYAGYNENVNKGNKAYSKEIYIDAIDYYENALQSKKTDSQVWIKLSDSYYHLGQSDQFLSTMEKAIDALPNHQELYVKLANYYIAIEDYESLYKILYSANDVKDRKEIDSMIEKYRDNYTTIDQVYTNVGTWHDGYMVVQSGENYGLVNANGKLQLDTIYQNIGSFDSELKVVPVQLEDKWFYVTIEGYKKLVGDHEYTYLGTFNDGYAPASYKDKYGWIDNSFKDYKFEYDYTTMFIGNVAAVKKGDKWALINKKFKLLTDFIYDEVKLDENGSIGNGEAIFVKQNNVYSLVDNKGKKISKEVFEDVRAFQGDQYAAVKKNGKWGFISTKGKKVIDYQYADAHSFCNGVAGVSNGTSWGAISQDKKVILDYNFQDIRAMSSNGVLVVKLGEQWQCIKIYSYLIDES